MVYCMNIQLFLHGPVSYGLTAPVDFPIWASYSFVVQCVNPGMIVEQRFEKKKTKVLTHTPLSARHLVLHLQVDISILSFRCSRGCCYIYSSRGIAPSVGSATLVLVNQVRNTEETQEIVVLSSMCLKGRASVSIGRSWFLNQNYYRMPCCS